MRLTPGPTTKPRIHPLSIEAIVLAEQVLIILPHVSGIHPLSIEAIVLARKGKTSKPQRNKYPSSINRGYRSGQHRLVSQARKI